MLVVMLLVCWRKRDPYLGKMNNVKQDMRGPAQLIQGDFGKEGSEEDSKTQKSGWD